MFRIIFNDGKAWRYCNKLETIENILYIEHLSGKQEAIKINDKLIEIRTFKS